MEDTLRRKTRSASICAPGFSSMEQMLGGMPPSGASRERDSGSGTPDGNTPTRRRKPATRSQSARVSGGNKATKKRSGGQAQQQHHHHHHNEGSVRSAHCSSEPRLAENDVSPGLRRRNSRRGQSMHHTHQRRSNAFLDVPDASAHAREEVEDETKYRLRSFSLTNKGKGIVNRGDSFRKRRSRSNSLAPGEQEGGEDRGAEEPKVVTSYSVAMLGARGVGKTALVNQFMTSECINAFEGENDRITSKSVYVMLNNEESELKFVQYCTQPAKVDQIDEPDAYVIMYSVVDKSSFQMAEQYIKKLNDSGFLKEHPIILVANKMDLARARQVHTQVGRYLAYTYKVKFIEISVGINHHVDDLLVGILSQIRLKVSLRQNPESVIGGGDGGGESSDGNHWYKSKTVIRASMKARQMLTWLFGKEDSKLKACENLHIL